MNGSNMPSRCPACGGRLQVQKLQCSCCDTEVQGNYRLCPVCALGQEKRALLDLFLEARGNLKDVQRAIDVSYPTARQRIEEMFKDLEAEKRAPDALEILAKVRRGELSVDEAESLLRGG